MLEDRRVLSAADGLLIFESDRDGGYRHIFRMDPDGSNVTQLTFGPYNDAIPEASEDGSKIVFASDRNHPGFNDLDIFMIDWDGSDMTLIAGGAGQQYDPSISPNNRYITFQSGGVGGVSDLYMVDLQTQTTQNLTNDALNESFAAWGGDGRSLIYTTNVNGSDEIFLMTFDANMNVAAREQLTFDGATRDFYPDINYFNTQIAWTKADATDTEIYLADLVADSNGNHSLANIRNLTNSPGSTETVPYFNPDESDKISFFSNRDIPNPPAGTSASEIYTMVLDTGVITRLTNDTFRDIYPTWVEDPGAANPEPNVQAFGPWESLGGFVQQTVSSTNADGSVALFGIGGDNAVWMRVQIGPNGAFYNWVSLGGYVKQCTVGRNASGALTLFAIGGDNAAWMRVQNGPNGAFGAWTSLGGFVKELSVGQNANGSLALFAIGGDNAAWMRVQTGPNGAFGTWTSLGGFVKELSVGQNADGSLALFGIGGDNAAWVRTQSGPNGAFGTWTSLGGFVKQLTVGRNHDGRLLLFAIGGDNAAWVRTQTAPNGVFGAWTSLGGFVKQLTVAQNADGSLALFGIGGDNAAWARTQSGPNGVFDSWTSLGGLVKHLSLARNADGTLDLFAIGGDNAAWLRKQQGA